MRDIVTRARALGLSVLWWMPEDGITRYEITTPGGRTRIAVGGREARAFLRGYEFAVEERDGR